MARIMHAKYDGTCDITGTRFKAGDLIEWDNRARTKVSFKAAVAAISKAGVDTHEADKPHKYGWELSVPGKSFALSLGWNARITDYRDGRVVCNSLYELLSTPWGLEGLAAYFMMARDLVGFDAA